MATRSVRLCAPPLAPAEETALGWVAAVLAERGLALSPAAPAAAPTLTLRHDATLGHAEAFALAPGPGGLTLAAGGPPGLLYGLAELAARLRLAPPGAEPLAAVPALTARPRHAVRSQALYLHHQRCEAEWFHDPAFWEEYCALLARSRYNRFSLVYGHQTAYLSPPWPYLVAVPGYDHLQPTGCTADDRARHLATLRLIVAACTRWRLAFTLGVWQQFAGEYPANGVPALRYDDTFAYAPRGLAAVLAACPDIRGVQFRMNSEAGIHEDHQERFFSGLFAVLRDHPGLDWLDLRAKGLRAETIAAAERLGLPVTVSTKFWCEHTGQPTFATRVNPSDDAQYRRYGYWDLLRRDRRYRLLYRLWNVGTNRVLLWGDPAWARRFAQSCHTGDAQGAEVMAPLTNLGYGNRGPAWHVLPDPALRYTRAELLRYWPLVMNLGLALYQDAAEQPVLTAEYARRLGPAGPRIEPAMAAAGSILPSLTAYHCESASTFGYWPELSPGGLLDAYPGIATGDIARFRRADEELAALLADRPDPRSGPEALAQHLRQRAAEAAADLSPPTSVRRPQSAVLSPPSSARRPPNYWPSSATWRSRGGWRAITRCGWRAPGRGCASAAAPRGPTSTPPPRPTAPRWRSGRPSSPSRRACSTRTWSSTAPSARWATGRTSCPSCATTPPGWPRCCRSSTSRWPTPRAGSPPPPPSRVGARWSARSPSRRRAWSATAWAVCCLPKRPPIRSTACRRSTLPNLPPRRCGTCWRSTSPPASATARPAALSPASPSSSPLPSLATPAR
jgi:hypothetical protein